MKVRTKTALVIAGTLLVGGLLGSLITSQVTHARMERIYRMRTSEGFVQTIEDIVQPIHADQHERIAAVARNTSERIRVLYRGFRVEREAVIDSMHMELKEVLTPEQWQRLDAWHQERRARHRLPPDQLRPRPTP